MADQFALSYDGSQPNMIKYPLYLQATGADPALTYSAQTFRDLIASLVPYQGVMNADGFVCKTRGAGANFSVDITAGRAIVNGTTSATQASFHLKTTGTVNLTTPSAPASGSPRLHKVVAEVLDKQAAGSQYGWQFHLIEDTTGGTLPATPASAIPIAQISIAVAQSSVTTANIIDLRPMAQTHGAWMSYTPTWTLTGGSTGSNPGAYGRYRRIGTSCLVSATLVGGTGASLGSGNVTFTLPFPVQSTNTPAYGVNVQLSGAELFMGDAMLQTTIPGGVFYPLTVACNPGSTSASVLAQDPTPGTNHYKLTTPGGAGLSWSAGGVLNCNLEYECAP